MEEALRASCQSDNDFFKDVINLIPPIFYFDTESKHKLKEITHNNFAPGDSGKNARKSEWKLAKYDPTHVKTVTEMQRELLSQENNATGSSAPVKSTKNKAACDDCSLKSATDSLEELREKLHHKLQTLKDKRKCMKKADWLEKRRLKRKESKMKGRLKRSGGGVREERPPPVSRKAPTPSPHKPIYNKQGHVVFSKFDFTDNKTEERPDRDAPTGKNYKRLLEKVQRQKVTAEQLRETDPHKARQLEDKTKWSAVLHKAQGVKVKDNEQLLNKALKRKEKAKQKTRKQWDSRQDQLDKKVKDRQDKRRANITRNKQAKLNRKITKAKKKGRVVPGF